MRFRMHPIHKTSTAALATAGVVALGATAQGYTRESMGIESKEKVPHVRAQIQGRSGSELYGYVSMSQVKGGVRVEVQVRNASVGAHGVHFHQKADCSASDGKSAGGHFNPKDTEHGLPKQDPVHHVGDLGNIQINDQGFGALYALVEGATLDDDADTSLLDRGLIVHTKRDDGGQPTSNAGARIGCAEIPDEVASS
jgi:superoxide dismutase, Cu-Zn family